MRSKIYFLASILLFIASPKAESQLIVSYESSQKIGKEKNKSESTHYYSENALKIYSKIKYKDEKGEKKEQVSSTIIRNDKKTIWVLIPEQKGYCEFTFEDLKKYSKAGQSLFPDDFSLKENKIEKTGEKKKIAGFEAQGYIWKKEKGEGKAWLTFDRKFDTAFSFYKKLAENSGVSAKSDSVALKSELKTENYTYETQARDVKFEKIAAEEFEIPSGYKKISNKVWESYRQNFDEKMIINAMKEELKNKAREAAAEEGKEVLKKGLKGALGI